MALVVLVLLSLALRAAAAFGVDAPWIAPDEMLYGVLGRAFWKTGQMRLFGTGAPFYGYYPIFAGWPLAVFGPGVGLAVLKVVQVLVVSSTALIVYGWSRRLATGWWSFAAAAMTVALPALAYSGLMMTESVFLPTMTLALSLLARALSAPSPKNQLVAAAALALSVAVRLQGLGLLPAAVVAALLMAYFERDRRIVLRFVPFFVASAFALVTISLGRFAVGAVGGSIGAYGTVATGGFQITEVLRWSFREAGDLFLLVAGLPLLATAALAVERVRRRGHDVHVSALLAVGLGYGAVTVAQVGAFASEYVRQLAERDLITVAPPLFVAFVVWLARGMPRSFLTAAVVLVVAIPATLLPMREVTDGAVPDAFMTVPLLDLAKITSHATLTYVWPATAALIAVLLIIADRRLAPVFAGLVVVALVATSVLAQREVARRSRVDRLGFFEQSSPRWIDQTVASPVAYLDDGDPLWNGVWHQVYWNNRIETVATLSRKNYGRLTGSSFVSAPADGRLLQPGIGPLRERLVVAPKRLTLIGRRIKAISQGQFESGLQLWGTDGPPTLSTRTTGIGHSGGATTVQVGEPARVTVYACGPGLLGITFRPEDAGVTVRLSVGQLRPVRALIKPGYFSNVWVAAPPDADGRRTCKFEIIPRGNLSWTNIRYERGQTSVPRPARARRLGNGVTVTYAVVTRGARLPAGPPRIGYCIRGVFANLVVGQPETDKTYKGATIANFVAGKGLTCDPPPPGFVQHSFATAAMGVSAGVYPYYAP